MNKGDLIESVAAELGESKATASKVVEAVLISISSGVNSDEKVAIAGFGTFKKKFRKERNGINPATKQPITIAASTTVGFTPSQALKETMNNGQAK